MNITIFGAGYVGLVAAACFADKGNKVTCVDVDEMKVARLNQGIIPIYEPELEEVVTRNKDRLHFTTDLAKGVHDSEVLFIAVGTPQRKDSTEADLTYVESVIESIATIMKEHKIVVMKSTVPVGTSKLVESLMQKYTQVPFTVVSNPEFLREGTALGDFQHPDRVVVGTNDPHAQEVLRSLYAPFTNHILFMDNTSAELGKYGANVMLASRLAVVNEFARIAQVVGADALQVRNVIGSDPRIGSSFLHPGPGYGGSCLPKDVREITALADRLSVPLYAIPAIDTANEAHKAHFAERVFAAVPDAKKVAVWGAAFKANTDDIRESPSLVLIKKLLDAGVTVSLCDAIAEPHVKKLFGDSITYADQYQCLEGADCLVIMTEWETFRRADVDHIKSALKHPVIIDGRNLFEPSLMREKGIRYFGVGRQV